MLRHYGRHVISGQWMTRCRKTSRFYTSRAFPRQSSQSSRLFRWWMAAPMAALTVAVNNMLSDREKTFARWSTDSVGSPKVTDIYEITDEVIGEGGYGIVTKGINRHTGEVVAIKQMSKRETSARDFWAEVDLLRVAGKHPNIMTLRGVYEKEDTWYIVQELATGGELFDHLIHNGAYSEQQASETMRDLCGALQHLHNKGIIHGDVKPENILLHKGQMCLVDFGVSFRLGEQVSAKSYEGTTAYSAPEILSSATKAPEVSEASDMFALGVVMYILLCGVHPFDKFNSLSDDEIRLNIIQNKVDLNDKFSDFISDDARDLLSKLLEPDPSKRITAAQALQHPWLLPETQLDTEPLPDRAQHLKKFQRGRRRLRASILAVLLTAAAGGRESKEAEKSKHHEAMAWGISSNPQSAESKADTVISAIQVFDQDNKGYISKTDLQRVSKDLGKTLDDDDVHEMITAADGDPDHSPSKVEYDDVKMAFCSLRSSNFENGEVIIREGATDDVFYFLMDGDVEVTCSNVVKDKSNSFFNSVGDKRVVLRRISKGSYFGELELLQPEGKIHPRVASYRCVSPVCKVLTLLPEDFETLTDVYESFEDKTQHRVTEQAQDQLIKCIENAKGHIKRLELNSGDVLFREGEATDLFYIIVSGQVKVSRQGKCLETLQAGDYFPLGVSRPLQDDVGTVRKTTVECVGPTKVIEIGGEVYRSFLKSHKFMAAYFQEQIDSREHKREICQRDYQDNKSISSRDRKNVCGVDGENSGSSLASG